MGLLSLGAVAIVGISASAVYAQSDTTAPTDQPPAVGQQRPERGDFGRGQDNSAILAEVLGITQEELQAAVKTARDAAIAQALADGTITQEQADAMKAEEGGRGLGWGPLGKGADHDTELAQALGITLEELQTAKEEVNKRVLAEQVASGAITQEDADLMTARQALGEYLQDRMQAAYEAGVAQAVTDGVITQAQADQILNEEHAGFVGPGFGPHGDGPHGDGPRGGRPDRGPGQAPDQAPSAAPAQPDDSTQQSGQGA
jgi:hypothetical protein